MLHVCHYLFAKKSDRLSKFFYLSQAEKQLSGYISRCFLILSASSQVYCNAQIEIAHKKQVSLLSGSVIYPDHVPHK